MFRWGEQVRALYPVYDWIAGRLGGRRRLATLLLTISTDRDRTGNGGSLSG